MTIPKANTRSDRYFHVSQVFCLIKVGMCSHFGSQSSPTAKLALSVQSMLLHDADYIYSGNFILVDFCFG